MDAKEIYSSIVPESSCYFINFSPTDPYNFNYDLKRRLTQEPVEIFDLQFASTVQSYDNNWGQQKKSKTTYKFKLRFHNNLHEVCKNYYYELVVKAWKFDDQQSRQVQTLFSITKNRITDVIDYVDIQDVGPREIRHYTLYIRRYKDDSNAKQEITKVDSIGSMPWSTGVYSDISLIVGDKILRVHKKVLSQKSEVFKKMFAHKMAESQNGIVKIDDLDVEVVEEMLSYVYTGRAGNIAKMPRELFEAAHKYQLHELQSLCEEHFSFNVNYKNAVDILTMADLYDLEGLRKGMTAFVQKYEKEMVQESSFRSFLCRTLKTNNAVNTLLIAIRNGLDDVKEETLKFIKDNDKDMMKETEFLNLFRTEPELIKEVFMYIVCYREVTETNSSHSSYSSV